MARIQVRMVFMMFSTNRYFQVYRNIIRNVKSLERFDIRQGCGILICMNHTGIVFSHAESNDLPVLESLLAGLSLPIAGVADHVDAFWLAKDSNRVVGCAGLELYGEVALLRSLAVDRECRNQGIAGRLVERTVVDARERSVKRLFLLTTTAREYFLRLGFEPLPRSGAPEELAQSVEFQGACPASAVLMRLILAS
jgi:N-acetylglutamate synthase-like GNAT family acetyltransferase